MRIAMLHADLPGSSRGGVAHQVSQLANALTSRGNEVVMFALTPPPRDARYKTRQLNKPRFVPAGKIARLVAPPLAFARASYNGFDVVHAHGDSFLVRDTEVPVVRTFYGSAREEAIHATRLHWKLTQHALRYAELAAVPAATLTVGISRNTVQSLGTLDAVIACGVDTARFRPGPKSREPTILFVGALRGRKRGSVMLDAYRERIRPRLPSSELWFVTDEQVVLPGVRSFQDLSDEAMADLFRKAWIYACTSSYEGFGVPYIEAMASGTPIVTTPNAGALELIAGRDLGVLVGDRSLAPAIVSLIHDADHRTTLAENGLRHSRRFNWDQIASQYESAYRQAISSWQLRAGASRGMGRCPRDGGCHSSH